MRHDFPRMPEYRISAKQSAAVMMATAIICLAGTSCTNSHKSDTVRADPPTAAVMAGNGAAEAPLDPDAQKATAAAWKEIRTIMGKPGELKDGVLTFTYPRSDLSVTVDSMSVPSNAGIESIFYFYRCSCGRINVVGQFCVVDFEANDVIDVLRAANMNIASIAPLFISDRPKLLMVRFHGEGHEPGELAKSVRKGFDWMGPARMATQPMQQ